MTTNPEPSPASLWTLSAALREIARLEARVAELEAITDETIGRASKAVNDAAETGVPWDDLDGLSRAFVEKLVRAVLAAR
jgi:hypothetical protein